MCKQTSKNSSTSSHEAIARKKNELEIFDVAKAAAFPKSRSQVNCT